MEKSMFLLTELRKSQFLRFIFVVIPSYMRYNYYKLYDKSSTFMFNGETYNYFNHWYNTTWNDERAVEIPIICKYVSENNENNILEIGNVLKHYFNKNHDIVDKYEKGKGVTNEDVVNFQTPNRYKLIVSISTLEHVGWDETPRNPEKIFKALSNLKNLLVPGGKLVVTIPIGHNTVLDKYLKEGEVKFTENYYLKRISKSNKWIELKSGFANAKFNYPFPAGNVIFIGIYQKV
jgi:hypothetical protein